MCELSIWLLKYGDENVKRMLNVFVGHLEDFSLRNVELMLISNLTFNTFKRNR